MTAILLCAGFGTRMYPLTRDVPKPLLPVAGTTILDDLVDQIAASRPLSETVVITNARFADRFEAWRAGAEKRYPESRFVVLNDGAEDDANRLGAVRDLAFAVDRVALDEPVLVAAGDNLFRFEMDRFFADFDAQPRSLVLRYRDTDRARLRRTGVAEIDEADGRLRKLVEKPDAPPTSWACPAFYLLEPEALALVTRFIAEAETRDDTDAIGRFIAWLCERRPVFTHEMQGHRLDVGDKESYARAEAWLASMG